MIDKEIKDKKDCMGCYACTSICPKNCISMMDDEEGFWYPEVDYNKCIKCNKCVNVCPIIHKTNVENKPVAYACINKDDSIRMESSSGGVFTLIAEHVISEGGIVIGAEFNIDFNVEHNFVEIKEDLDRLRGSKYVQSRIGNTYVQIRDFLKQGKKVLFTGTPCQIEGLKSYLGQPYEILSCVDIVCHGVPSPDIWEKYVDFREKIAGSTTKRIAFRRKDEGWKQYSVSFSFINNTEYRQSFSKDLYMRAFLKDVCLRPSCYDCKFKGLNRQSDITLADFWGIQNMLPEMDDNKGTSLILINNKNGQALFDEIKDRMEYQEVDFHEAVKYNSAAIKSSSYNPKREGFMAEKEMLPFDKLVDKYCTDSLSTRLMRKVRSSIKKIMVKSRLL